MTSSILRLNSDELWQALDEVNPVWLLAKELIGRTVDPAGRDRRPIGRLAPWQGEADGPAAELVVLEDLPTGTRCVLPVATVRMFRTAALAALAARELVVPGVVTAAILGSGPAAQPLLTLIARYVSGISHIAVWQAGAGSANPVEPRVRDQLDLAGIGLSFSAAVDEAVFGANLVIAADIQLERLEIRQCVRGSVLVNTVGRDLPNDLVDGVDQIYVDDVSLLGENRHRYFVNRHFGEPDSGARRRFVNGGQPQPAIEADLGQVLAGTHAGRRHMDDILLVELLGAGTLDVLLASGLYRAASERGLGIRL